MKSKVIISIVLTLLMIVSTFAVGTGNITTTGCPGEEQDPVEPGRGLTVVKTIWDGEEWTDPVTADIGEDVRFNISITYNPVDTTPENEDGDGIGYKAMELVVNDTFPDCLEYNNSLVITHGTHVYTTDSHDVIGNSYIWYLSDDYGIELWDTDPSKPRTLFMEFNATVISDCINVNHVNVTGFETCGQEDLWDEDTAEVNIPEEENPEISINKKVKDPESGEWIEGPLTVYYDELGSPAQLEFMINVSNTGNVDLNNPVVTDILPDFLEFDDQSTIPPGLSFSQDGQELTWTWVDQRVEEDDIFLYIWVDVVGDFDELKEGTNFANVTVDEDVYDEDFVDITLKPHFTFEKKVWNGTDWADSLDHVNKGENVRFKLTGTYYGDDLMKCYVAADKLPFCLEYADNEEIWIGGEKVTEGDQMWPEIYVGEDEIVEVCDHEFELTEGMIVWDWRNTLFGLSDGESVVIEFDTAVTEYCDDCCDACPRECWDENCALGALWGCMECSPCEWYIGSDCVDIRCCPPPTTFTKEVYDEGEWEDSIDTVVGSSLRFKLELEYFGEENLTYVNFVDELPCVLLYDNNVDIEVIGGNSVGDIEPEISNDGKTLWWNLSDVNLTDGGKIIIKFDAYVNGTTGSSCGCGEVVEIVNWAEVRGYHGCLPIPELLVCNFPLDDEVSITAHGNCPPSRPSIRGPQTGEEGETLTYYFVSSDSDGDQIRYNIKWGDGTVSLGTTLYNSGEEIDLDHTYDEAGTYKIKAEAVDEHGATHGYTPNSYEYTVVIEESGQEGLKISIPKMFYMKNIGAVVENVGEDTVEDIVWTFNVTGGLLGFDIGSNGTIEELEGESTETVLSGPITLKIGKAEINVTAKTGDYDEEITKSAFVFGRLIFVM